MRPWLKILLIVLGLAAWAAIVWLVGPLIAWGDNAPFDSVLVRILLIAAVFATVGGWYGWKFWRRRKAARHLENALRESSEASGDGQVLEGKMGEALETLKRASGKQSYLYELPWYIIIGPPGAGKTTALVNSGLKFPLAGADGATPVAGVGGTRYCDWWFTEDAVLIDTAGRYTTQDSDAEGDKKSWLSFLSLLKQNRPKQPINGVILAVSLEDLMTLPEEELVAHSNAIRKRLLELHQELKIDFPVYSLFTKADLIRGFAEYFGSFAETRRRKVWGATFQTEDRSKNLVGQVPTEFDALTRRLTEELPDRLHEEPDPIARIAIFGFPGQFATLRDSVAAFLNRIFEPTRYQANANLRGFYFSSGTQEGTPIDQVLGAMGRHLVPQSGGRDHYSGTGKSFFLFDLMKNVIFAESGWVSRDIRAVRRAMMVYWGGIALVAVASLAAIGVWSWSYANNRFLITSTDNAIAAYRANAVDELNRAEVSDVNLESIVGILNQLRSIPVGYDRRADSVPVKETFGLSQRERLVSASDTSYRRALERMLRSRLILRLEQQIDQNRSDPIVVYEALKVYLMLGGQAPKVDDDLVLTWLQRDWEDNLLPGAASARTREELLGHVKAMLALGRSQQPSFELSGDLITAAQQSLARMNIADRAYTLVKTSAYSAGLRDYSIVEQGGPDTTAVFETVDGTDIQQLKVDGLYTYSGFHGFFLDALGDVAKKLLDEQWVMGKFGEQKAVEEQFKRLGPELLERYRRDFVEAWEKVLGNLKLKPMSADKPEYKTLAYATSPTTPLKTLFESVVRETALTKESPDGSEDMLAAAANGKVADGLKNDPVAKEGALILLDRFKQRQSGLVQIGIDLALKKSQQRAGQVTDGGSSAPAPVIPGANIEAYFKDYQLLVEGDAGQRPIDTLTANFYEVYRNLVLAASNPSQAAVAMSNMQVQVVNLRANASRLPRPLARMVASAVDDFEGDAADTSIAQLNQMLASTVTQACQRSVEGRYPFSRGSTRDVPMSDFGRMFGPNGIIDGFFAKNLADYADLSAKTWVWKQDTRFGRELSKSALRQFQLAAQIKDAFFPTGGTMPSVQLTITPNVLSGDAEQALLNINGSMLQSQQVGNTPLTMQWPGGGAGADVSILPELLGRDTKLVKSGPWAFMRLIDAGSAARQGDNLLVRFVVGGREVSYKIQVGSVANPFFLPALADFKCPTGL